MPQAGFEPIIPGGEWSQIHASDRAATGIGKFILSTPIILVVTMRQYTSGRSFVGPRRCRSKRAYGDSTLPIFGLCPCTVRVPKTKLWATDCSKTVCRKNITVRGKHTVV
jgi:hypothetical protein